MSAAQARVLTISRAGQADQILNIAPDALVRITQGDAVLYRSEVTDALQHIGKTRDGNQYDRVTGARRSPIVAGDLAYRYSPPEALDQLKNAIQARGQVDAVVIIDEADKSRTTIANNYAQPEPVDFYLQHPDASLERCDKDGNLDPTLETRTQDNSGVNDSGNYTGAGTGTGTGTGGGSTGTGSTPTPGGLYRAEGFLVVSPAEPMTYRNGQFQPMTFGTNNPIDQSFDVPAGAGGQIQIGGLPPKGDVGPYDVTIEIPGLPAHTVHALGGMDTYSVDGSQNTGGTARIRISTDDPNANTPQVQTTWQGL